jgi:hypothetical protein
LIPAVFLGIAIVMATFYLAYPTEAVPTADWPEGAGTTPENQRERTAAFMEWVASAARERTYALRSAVVGLAFGVAFLPIAFLSLGAGGLEPNPSALRPGFPAPPDEVSDPALATVLYEAEVAETAAIRARALEARPAETLGDWRVATIYGLAVAALLLTFLHPLIFRRATSASTGGE